MGTDTFNLLDFLLVIVIGLLAMILRLVFKAGSNWAVLNERVQKLSTDIVEVKGWIKDVVGNALRNS